MADASAIRAVAPALVRWLRLPTGPRPALPAVLLVGLAAAALCGPALHGTAIRPPDAQAWSDPPYRFGDFGAFVHAGRALLEGHPAAVYADPTIQTGPLDLLWCALLALALRAVHAGGTVGALVSAAAALVPALYAVMLWAARRRPPRWLPGVAALALLMLVIPWQVVEALAYQHVTYLWVPALWLLAGDAVHRGRPGRAGAALVLATALESWGVLAVPVVAAALPTRHDRWRVLVGTGAGTVAVWAPFVFSGRFRMGEMTWPNSAPNPITALFGNPPAVTWQVRAAQAVVIVAASLAARAAAGEADGVAVGVLVVTWTRLLVETQAWPYYRLSLYLTTSAVVLAAAADRVRSGGGRSTPALALGLVLLALVAAEFPPLPAGPVLLAHAVLLAGFVAAARAVPAGPGTPGTPSLRPARPVPTPDPAGRSDPAG